MLKIIFRWCGDFLRESNKKKEMNKYQNLIIKGNYDNFLARPPIVSLCDTKG